MNEWTPYERAYQSLNERQKLAVETIYGPLMVIAGPGTGKTQLLSTRIGYILQHTDFRPFNFLCLTFSNNGVAAMKKRLVELIGHDAHDIEVSTFHSFAEKVIQRYHFTHEVEEYQFLDELDKRIIVRELLETIDFNSPLKKGVNSVDTSIRFLMQFFDQIIKEKYDIHALRESYLTEKLSKKDAPEYYYKRKSGDKNVGDFKQSEWDKFENKIDKHIQACDLYLLYKEKIASLKLLDYHDQITKAIEILQNHEYIRLDFQERFQIIMIDEYQDTNGAQLELANCLTIDNDDPNIMVVGDEDQSIFRFQGANVYNMHSFYEHHLSGRALEEQLERIIVLEENYRSTPYILESSQMLIANNSERITHLIQGHVIDKKLISSHPDLKQSREPVSYIEVSQSEDMGISIILEIEKLIANGVAWHEIAVLFPKNDLASDFSKYLTFLNFPFELSRDEDILQDPTVLSIIRLLEMIEEFQARKTIVPESISQLLMMPWNGFTLTEIAQFWSEWHELKPENNLSYIENYNGIARFSSLMNQIRTCIQKKSQLTPHRYFHFILDTFGVKQWALLQLQRIDLLQKIECLDRFIADYIEKYKENNRFSHLLTLIASYQREQVPIEYVKHLRSESSIQLMTYHKSKGLEYEYVFVYGAGRFTSNNTNKIYIPEEILAKNIHIDNETAIEEEEKRRLLYVAMTRAKKKLFLVDVAEKEANKKSKNKFLSEIGLVSEKVYAETPDIEAIAIHKHYEMREEDYLRFYSINQTHLDLKEEALYENQYIEHRIQNFVLSHSSINTYLECPQKFYFEKIVNVPRGSNFQMTVGNFYHKVLEIYFKSIKTDRKNARLEDLLSIARTEVLKYRFLLTEYEWKDMQKAFESNLPILFNQYLSKIASFEYEVEDRFELHLGPLVVTGYIDKWDVIDGRIVVSDFKTGKYKNAKDHKKLNPVREAEKIKNPEFPTVDELYGGNYWRQAMIYSLMVKERFPQFPIKSIDYTFIIPDDNEIKTHSFAPDIEAEDYIKNLILKVDSDIKAKKFDGCQNPDCEWCQNVSYRQQSMN